MGTGQLGPHGVNVTADRVRDRKGVWSVAP